MKAKTVFTAAIVFASLTLGISAATLYVDVNSTNPVAPYSDWSTASTNIQTAMGVANPGDLILVTNGMYVSRTSLGTSFTTVTGPDYSGFNTVKAVFGIHENVTVKSVNGPAVTIINGRGSMTCAVLFSNAVLSGFTLTNGNTVNDTYAFGSGACCVSTNSFVYNCIVCSNVIPNNNIYSHSGGAGVYMGTLSNCLLFNNRSYGSGGGAFRSTLYNCSLRNNYASDGNGGGVAASTLFNCLVAGNTGGGASGGILNNCVLKNNVATEGGGAGGCILINCTVVSNTATIGPAGGTYGGSATNCIIYYNTPYSAYSQNPNYFGTAFSYCDTFAPSGPLPSEGGINNITNEPVFFNVANGDFHLKTNSPCIDAGNNAYSSSTIDFDGRQRIVNGIVDIGAFEFQNASIEPFIIWLDQYGVTDDGSADNFDSDGDGLNNWQEWIAGTNPTNAASVLKMFSPGSTNNSSGIIVSWQSVTNVTYFLNRSSDLCAQPAFSTIQSNIIGQAGTTSFADTSATNSVPYFYRVGVQ